jgi:hypothetical protein
MLSQTMAPVIAEQQIRNETDSKNRALRSDVAGFFSSIETATIAFDPVLSPTSFLIRRVTMPNPGE